MAYVEPFDTIYNSKKTKRVIFTRRTDGLYTYAVERLRNAETPGYAKDDPDDTYWSEVRDGGLFETESDMREDAEHAPDWPQR